MWGKLLFVDDMEERHTHIINTWKGEIQNLYTAQEAIEVLSQNQDFDIVSLDHDLQSEHYTRACSANSGCGCDIVDWICENKELFQSTRFVIHSWNPDATKRMQRALYDAGLNVRVIRFSVLPGLSGNA